jgi:hypothetical protein
MRLGSRLMSVAMIAGIAILAMPLYLFSQAPGSHRIVTAASVLPEAPQPQIEVASTGSQTQQTPANQSQTAQQPGAQKNQQETSAEQLKAEEKQRVMGVMATFNTTRDPNALPLSPKQKFQLYFKSVTDPWAFSLSAVVAGIGQADNSTPEWGQGMQGYAKRFGAGYTDYAMGNFFGNALLPSLWHEDPRYYQKGSGPVITRILWAASSTVWCRRDKGTWGPNYGNVIGNLIGSSIARAYYPPEDRTVGGTITDGLTVTYEGIIGAEVIEFWPDMVRHHRRKNAEKEARREANAAASSH